MSRYTVEYGVLYDSGFQPLLDGLASYPIYDEAHRAELNQKIYDRYRFREIGAETAALFTHYFLTTLREIMPMYNELYRTAAATYDFLSDVDLTELENVSTSSDTRGSANSSSSDTSQSASTTHDSHAHSDTPQGSFNFSSVEGNEYLSDADANDGTASASTNASGQTASQTAAHGDGQSERTKRITGKSPGRTYAQLIKEYREQILNIDRMILDELATCFMGVY